MPIKPLVKLIVFASQKGWWWWF